MTFYEWMNNKYPDPDTAFGELTAYIRDIDALRTAVAYADFIPHITQHVMPRRIIRLFDSCWSRYCDDCFWFSDFLHDCCIIDPQETEKSGSLIETFRRYTVRRNRMPRTSAALCAELAAHGFSRRKTKHGMLVEGLKLKYA